MQDRKMIAQKWLKHEERVIEACIEAFKKNCFEAAEREKCEVTCSFEVLSREIPIFPTRVQEKNTWNVTGWGDPEVTDESWFYATHSNSQAWVPGTPVNFAEVLAGVFNKFLERMAPLGFQSCERQPGTWKVRASWLAPDPPAGREPPPASTNNHTRQEDDRWARPHGANEQNHTREDIRTDEAGTEVPEVPTEEASEVEIEDAEPQRGFMPPNNRGAGGTGHRHTGRRSPEPAPEPDVIAEYVSSHGKLLKHPGRGSRSGSRSRTRSVSSSPSQKRSRRRARKRDCSRSRHRKR